MCKLPWPTAQKVPHLLRALQHGLALIVFCALPDAPGAIRHTNAGCALGHIRWPWQPHCRQSDWCYKRMRGCCQRERGQQQAEGSMAPCPHCCNKTQDVLCALICACFLGSPKVFSRKYSLPLVLEVSRSTRPWRRQGRQRWRWQAPRRPCQR